MKDWRRLDPVRKEIPIKRDEFVPEAAMAILITASAAIAKEDKIDLEIFNQYLKKVGKTINLDIDEIKKILKEVIS